MDNGALGKNLSLDLMGCIDCPLVYVPVCQMASTPLVMDHVCCQTDNVLPSMQILLEPELYIWFGSRKN